MAGSTKINKWLEMAITIVCFLIPSAVIARWYSLQKATDFLQYYCASNLMHSGAYNHIYSALPANISPTVSWLFYPLVLFNFKYALYLWIFILIMAGLVMGLMLCRFLGLKNAKRIWVLALLGAMGPFVLSLWKGYFASLLLLVLMGLLVNLKKRNFLMASIYQTLFWLQPQLLLPLLCFEIGMGQFYTVLITVLLAIIGLLMSCLMGGFGLVNSWYFAFVKYINNGLAALTDITFQGELLRFGV